MLRTDPEPTFAELLEKYPQVFRIPEELTVELTQKGELPNWEGPNRVATRFRCCSPVVVTCHESPAPLAMHQPTSRCLLRDISQSGMSFLAGEQYYPEQVLKIVLPIARSTVRVVRCRYIDQDCFEIGVRTMEYVQLG